MSVTFMGLSLFSHRLLKVGLPILQLAVVSCLVVGCAGNRAVSRGSGATVQEPGWWSSPHDDDSFHIYVKASSAGHPTEQIARQAAYQAALAEIAKRISVDVTVSTADEKPVYQLNSAQRLVGTKIAFEETAEDRHGWRAWLLVTYPRDDFDRLVDEFREPYVKWEKLTLSLQEDRIEEAVQVSKEILAHESFPADLVLSRIVGAHLRRDELAGAIAYCQSVRSVLSADRQPFIRAQLEKLAQRQLELGLDVSEQDLAARKSRLLSLIEHFPLGEQQLFDTERAILPLANILMAEQRQAEASFWLVHLNEHASNSMTKAKARELLDSLGPIGLDEYFRYALLPDRKVQVSASDENGENAPSLRQSAEDLFTALNIPVSTEENDNTGLVLTLTESINYNERQMGVGEKVQSLVFADGHVRWELASADQVLGRSTIKAFARATTSKEAEKALRTSIRFELRQQLLDKVNWQQIMLESMSAQAEFDQ